jgi:hypothetical protein
MNMQRFIFMLVFGAIGLHLSAGPHNIAPLAKVSVSSELLPDSGGSCLYVHAIPNDGRAHHRW